LCGYVLQQNTVNNIRKAIKPPTPPVHVNLYVPPEPGASPAENSYGSNDGQVVEIVITGTASEQGEEKPSDEDLNLQIDGVDGGEELIQGKDGGFLRVQRTQPDKSNGFPDGRVVTDSRGQKHSAAYQHEISDPRKSAEESRESTPDSRERLSRAARRKQIKDDIKKLAGMEPKRDANPYRRRRLW
jgi:hypothetical protein